MNPFRDTDIRDAPFPLFAAELHNASGYAAEGVCCLCQLLVPDRFRLGIGREIVYDCPSCARQYAVRADRHGLGCVDCIECGAGIALRQLPADPAVCVACIRAGRAAFTKDTEFGMVTWQDAVAGRTHGVPELQHASGFTMHPPNEDGWVSVEIPSAVLLELVQTPGYVTWQGEQWLFCCATAMVHIGEWTQSDVAHRFPDDPQAAFLEVFEGADPWVWNYMPRTSGQDSDWGFYVFSCHACGRLRGHFDMS